MKIYKMIGLTLVGVMLFNTPVMAESKESLDIASNEYENVEVQQVQEKESQKIVWKMLRLTNNHRYIWIRMRLRRYILI